MVERVLRDSKGDWHKLLHRIAPTLCVGVCLGEKNDYQNAEARVWGIYTFSLYFSLFSNFLMNTYFYQKDIKNTYILW